MNALFASDNVTSACPEVMDAIVAANSGIAESYGDDKSRFNAYSMKQRKGFELTKKESRELYRLGQKFSSK